MNLLEALDELTRTERDLKAATALVRDMNGGGPCDDGYLITCSCAVCRAVPFLKDRDENGKAKTAPADGGHAALVALCKSLIIGLEDAAETIHARCCTDAGCINEHREAAVVLDAAKPKVREGKAA